MKPKRIKTIALFLAAVFLLAGLVVGMVAVGAGDRSFREGFRSDEGWRMDARYWWEVPPVTPYQREQIREIMILVLDRYFGIDVSRMSPEEFEGIGSSLGYEKEGEVLRLFGYYAQKRGFEVPAGIFDMPGGKPAPWEEAPTPREKWWQLGAPEYRDEEIARMREKITQVIELSPETWEKVLDMSLREFNTFLDSLPRLPLRVVSLDEHAQCPYVIGVFGRIPSLSTKAEIREWLDRLEEVMDVIGPEFFSEHPLVTLMGPGEGVIEVGLYKGAEIDDALMRKIYGAIADKAENFVGIYDVPVVFVRSGFIILDLGTSAAVQPGAIAVQPRYGDRYRPIIGGILKSAVVRPSAVERSTTGFTVRKPIRWWFDDLDYVITGHLLSTAPTPINLQIFQPTVVGGNEAGSVSHVASMGGFADVARVAIHNWHVSPYIHTGGGVRVPVVGWRDPSMHEEVRISGITSGNSKGQVIETRFQVQYRRHPAFGAL